MDARRAQEPLAALNAASAITGGDDDAAAMDDAIGDTEPVEEDRRGRSTSCGTPAEQVLLGDGSQDDAAGADAYGLEGHHHAEVACR